MLKAHELADIASGNPNGEVVIDCGPLDDKTARNRADRIFALGVGKKNLTWGPSTRCARIFIRIPPTKRVHVLDTLPIIEEPWFWGSTHQFAESDEPTASSA